MTAIAAGGRPAQAASWNIPVAGRRPTNEHHLTPREDQVLGLVGLGMTNREIGGRLGIAEKTVKNTVTMVLAKLGLERRTQAVIYVTVQRMAADQMPAG
ncbi:helix-turn-helix domain-containing protein [Nakamurella panacisegetis]|uniref:helix-turn-helix domain-containing protein n=1 Tax=Nakamurella panacisegetis TaxID=1090615 RepID=UPI000B892C54|nr:helix-turn-helix transcriptional regulator [Nakamurella panacisegetis]